MASEIETLDDLKDLIVLEQFKNCVSDRVVTYISEQKSLTAYEAAVSADEFLLIHKTSARYKMYGGPSRTNCGVNPLSLVNFIMNLWEDKIKIMCVIIVIHLVIGKISV